MWKTIPKGAKVEMKRETTWSENAHREQLICTDGRIEFISRRLALNAIRCAITTHREAWADGRGGAKNQKEVR